MKRNVARRLLVLVIAALGLAMAIGGVQLMVVGGSWYYAIAGFGLMIAAGLLWLDSVWGVAVYTAVLAATLFWAVAEVGLHAWGVLARVGLLAALGMFLLPVGNLLRAARRARLFGARRAAATAAVLIAMLVTMGAIHLPHPTASDSSGVKAADEWKAYGGTLRGTRYSQLHQITPENVSQLELAWTYSSGDLAAGGSAPVDALGGLRGLYGISGLQATPLQIGNVLFTCTERNMAVALDAESGTELWRFDPRPKTPILTHSSCRGVAYHEQPAADGPCARRILHGSIDGRLWALDARTGAPCSGFGSDGSISLREGLSNPEIGYHMTAPGTVANGVIVVGAWIPDNQSTNAPSGVVRAFDVLSGKLAWAWDVGRPDRTGLPPPGETYTPGTPNVWSFGSADEALNLVYLPTGNASPDLWGGKRRPFDDQYSSSVVALDLATGQPRWSFQTTHHDLWDYDVPAQPVLYDIPMPNGVRHALIQPTKQGEIFVLDRRTGEPIVPMEERPVPQGAARGDWVAATQPFSGISVRPADLTEAQMWGITPLDHLWCRIRFREARYEGVYTPPGERPTINFPGSFGSISWGGVSIDERRSILISNKTSIAYYMHLVPREEAPEFARKRRDPTSYQWLPMEETPFVAQIRPFMSPLKIPCNQPPWGHLEAFDLVEARSIWKRTIGTARDSGPWGYPTGLPLPIGTPTQGGAITTASGLIFIAAATDRYLRAFDTQSGEELWRGRLPAGGQATPMTYRARSGRQFVVVSAGGHAGMRTRRGDYLVAFALPRS